MARIADMLNASLYGGDDSQPSIKRPIGTPVDPLPTQRSYPSTSPATADASAATPAAAPATDATPVALPGGTRNLRSFGNDYPTIADQTTANQANAADKAARTGGGQFDPAAPTPDPLATTSPGLLDPNANPSGVVNRVLTPGQVAATGSTASPAVSIAQPQTNTPGATVTDPRVSAAAATPAANDGTGATSASGRPLGYGQNVNGVQTFSDGSGTGNVPRTVTDAQITDLGKRVNTISDANFVNPGVGTNGVTPELGSVQVTRPGTGETYDPAADVAAARTSAASDLASIAMEDPRSTLGRAARNLRIGLGDLHGSATGRYTRGLSPYEQGVANLQQTAVGQIADAQQRAMGAQRESGETTRTGITANAGIQDALIRRPQGTPIQTDNGTQIVGPDNIARPLLDAKGNPVNETSKKQPVDEAGYAKLLETNTNRLLGVDPITGMIPDPTTGKQRAPTADEISAATDKAHDLTQRAFGLQPHQVPGTNGIPPQAAAMLKADPTKRAQFDQTFGAGAAAKVLGS